MINRQPPRFGIPDPQRSVNRYLLAYPRVHGFLPAENQRVYLTGRFREIAFEEQSAYFWPI